MSKILASLALAAALPLAALADGGIAVVASTGADAIQTGTEVRRDMLGECIAQLPAEGAVAAVSSATDAYLHGIDGTARDGWTQTWTSSVHLAWQVRQRFLYVVTTRGVGATAPPQFREEFALVLHEEDVAADPSESAHFAAESGRRRFFASAAEADASALRRARIRLRELAANVCPDGAR